MIDNVSFQGKSTLTMNPFIHEKLMKSMSPKHISDGTTCRLNPNSNYCADAHRTSILVLIFNGLEGIAKRISTNGNLDITADNIATEVRDLSKNIRPASKKLTAWIIGGNDIMNPERGIATVNTVNKIADAIEGNSKVHLSILAGDHSGYKDVFFSTHNGKMQVVLDENIGKSWRKELGQHFDIVELSNVSRMS